MLTTVVLARLLVPADFGLVALGVAMVDLLRLVADAGFGSAFVVRQDLGRRAQRTVLTVITLGGAAVAVLAIAAAPLMAALFDQPRLAGILAALGGIALLEGVALFYFSLLQRELEFARRFVGYALKTGVYAITSVALAIAGLGAWSIVLGHLAGTVVFTVALLWLAPYRVRPGFEWATAVDVFRTSRAFLVGAASWFLRENVDYLLVGRRLGTGSLGLYAMAFRLGDLPHLAVADPISQATFPAYARMRARGEDVAPAYLASLEAIALVSCPLGALLSALADPFTRTVFDSSWLGMIGPLGIFGVWATLRSLEVPAGWLLGAVGQASAAATASWLSLVPLTAGVLIATSTGGITAVAAVVLGHITLLLIAFAVILDRRAGISLAGQLRAVGPGMLGALVAWGTARGIAAITSAQPPALTLAAGAAAGVAVYVLVVVALDPALPHRARELLGRALGRAGASAE